MPSHQYFEMKGSGSKPLDNEDETSILEGLLDAFGSAFSLKQIANAYCKAGRDANLTGCCGYDLYKYAYKSPKVESISCAVGGNLNIYLKANGSKRPRKQKGHNDIEQEVLSALFHVPRSSEEFHARTFGVNTVKKSKASGKGVVEASTSMDTTVECKNDKINPHNAIEEEDEGDCYGMLRKAVREHRATIKEYYKSAADAFAKGDLSLGIRLLEQGQFYHTKAREADEESSTISVEPRNEETEDTVTLDLHENGAKEAIRLLKFHLSSLSGIPSMKYLKVIVETNDEDTSKGSRRQLIIQLLEKESINWIERENPGTILILLEEINPKHLSFARK